MQEAVMACDTAGFSRPSREASQMLTIALRRTCPALPLHRCTIALLVRSVALFGGISPWVHPSLDVSQRGSAQPGEARYFVSMLCWDFQRNAKEIG